MLSFFFVGDIENQPVLAVLWGVTFLYSYLELDSQFDRNVDWPTNS